MEWVETTGRSVPEAKEKALDELGVDEGDAEFEVIAEAQTGLFGRLRSEARVRARVRPSVPRAKDDRRSRDRKRRSAGGQSETTSTPDAEAGGGRRGRPAAATTDDGDASVRAADQGRAGSSGAGISGASGESGSRPRSGGSAGAGGSGSPGGSESESGSESAGRSGSESVGGEPDGSRPESGSRNRNRRRRSGSRPGAVPTGAERAQAERGDRADRSGDEDESAKGTDVEVDLERQAEVAVDFLTKLTAEFGVQANVTVVRPDDDTVEVQLTGPELGILIGPKGATLLAVQNLTRTVVFNETGGNNGHINVDVAGYRQKRTEALIRFAEQAANHVKTSGQRTALEPMSSIDRKIVHDTIANIEGVGTVSEGEEPRRRVVVLPG